MIFWEKIEQEVVAAQNEKCMILIELDANAKLGSQLIRNDPNKMSENGRLLKNLIDRPSLEVLNNSPLCEGTITRHRVTKNSEEKSVIDYIITCDKLRVFLEKMTIDDKRDVTLTKYATTKGRKQIVKSDHNILYAKFSIQYDNIAWRRPRKEVFNLKYPECQAKFKEVTSNSNKLNGKFHYYF